MISFKIPEIGPKLDTDAKISLSIIFCFASSILTYISIVDVNGAYVGSFGGMIGSLIRQLLGRAAISLPFILFYSGIILIRLQKNLEIGKDFNPRLVWGTILFLAAITGLLNIVFNIDSPSKLAEGGGLYGYIFYPFVLGNFGFIGGFLILIAIGLFGFFLISQLTFVQFAEICKGIIDDPSKFWELIPDLFEPWKRDGQSTIGLADSEDPASVAETKPPKKPRPKPAAPQIKNVETPEDLPIERISLVKRPNSEREWELPGFDILKSNHSVSDPGDVEANKEIIKTTFESFNISVEMDEVVTGPTVSQYTLKPASGVKISAIDSLQRDVALALAAQSLRLEAPIPGKSLVGIEIPNKIKSLVRFKDMIKSKEFLKFKADLPVTVGLDVAGHNLIHSISKMPHLLVAGATGSGKSVWINSMLMSLLYRYTPEELQLILVDMKKVELKLYENIPHLLAPVITEADKAINALKWTVVEMERRYKLLEEYGKRNIVDYNEFVRETNIPTLELEELPYLVFVIDELGDLMVIAKNEVEPIIVRLTQMSRAVGIHLVLGTQRPDTKVVTGLIKANVPSRIAFAVASQIDSRVILDSGGAEKLLGQGDGLFMSPSSIHPTRFQGCLIEELEIRKAVSFWRDQVTEKNYETNLNPQVLEPPRTKITVPGMQSSSDSDSGDILDQCREYVINQQGASTSMLQTAFGIGYPKARKIIDQLEQEGVVGPSNGSKPREVYVERD